MSEKKDTIQNADTAEFDKSKINNEELTKYEKKYSEKGFLTKVQKYGKSIGLEAIYKALQLWYVMQKPEVPSSTKVIIMGALGYLISPIDFIPDLVPVLGYTDDIVAITYALLQVHGYIDAVVKDQAKGRLDSIFGAHTSDQLD